MVNLKKATALMLSATMVLALAACGSKDSGKTSDNGGTTPSSSNNSSSDGKSPLYQENKTVIKCGTWFEQYYTSAHSTIDDNPDVSNVDNAQKNLENMRAIEKKYNIEFYFDNITWDGVIESINTTIMAGKPDYAVYQVDLQFGIGAVVNGYASKLEDYVLNNDKVEQKYKDIFTDAGSQVVKGLSLKEGETYLFAANSKNLGAYALGYNKKLLDEAGQDDPYQLYLDNKWTWDKWNEEMRAVLAKDASGNVTTWGFRGPWTTLFDELLMSNGAHIVGTEPSADGKVYESLTSTATTEVLEQLSKMYQDYKVSFWDASCDTAWNDNVYAWAQGNVGFWVAAAWIASEADKDQNMFKDALMVNWPVGPSGNKDTNAQFNDTTGNYYLIPANPVVDPALVFCVMYDWFNWYQDDLNLRDDDEWFVEWLYSEQGYNVTYSMGDEAKDYTMDLWQQIDFDPDYQIRGIIETGADAEHITVAAFQQANKQIVQDYIDSVFN